MDGGVWVVDTAGITTGCGAGGRRGVSCSGSSFFLFSFFSTRARLAEMDTPTLIDAGRIWSSNSC